MATDALYLDEPLLEDALKTPYFFNGRLLTREDLSQEQVAQRTRRSHLGRALGSGVAQGLEVEPDVAASAPGQLVLNVAPGVAITPTGDTLHLAEPVRLRFSMRPEDSRLEASSGADFGDCGTVVAATTTSTTGLYLLAIRCAAGKEGLAAVSGLGNEAAACNTKYRTSGVGFRALGLGTSAARDGLFRSRFAAECFGFFDAALVGALYDPLTGPAPLEAPVRPSPARPAASGYGLVDRLRARNDLLDCEVPLAVVRLFDNGGLDFLDTWPVRRSLVRPALSRRWWPFGGSDDRRRAEAEAAMLCFQDHVAAVAGDAAATAESQFAFLPGGGFLPIGENGFDAKTFLGAEATAVLDADFGRLRALVEESWRCDAIDLSKNAKPPLIYFVFPEAAGNWVFFLRRGRDVPVITTPPPAQSPPVESPPVGTPAPGPTPAEGKTKVGSLLVVAPSAWRKKRTDLALFLEEHRLTAIDGETALEKVEAARLASATSAGQGVLGKVPITRKSKAAPEAFDVARFKGALFFYRDKVEAGSHRLFVSDAKTPLEEADPLTVKVIAGRLNPVTLG